MRMLVRLQDNGTIINIDTTGDKGIFENFCISLPKGEYTKMRMSINSGSYKQFDHLIKTKLNSRYTIRQIYPDTIDKVFTLPYIVDENGSDIKIDVLPDMNIDLMFF